MVWSLAYVDCLVLRDRDADADGSLEQRMYAAGDASWSTTAAFDASGVVLERVLYDPYGNQDYRNADGTDKASSGYSWFFMYKGGRLNFGLYHFRSRDYSPALMRWVQADKGYFDGLNLYEAYRGSPGNFMDPSGLAVAPDAQDAPEIALARFFYDLTQAAEGSAPRYRNYDDALREVLWERLERRQQQRQQPPPPPRCPHRIRAISRAEYNMGVMEAEGRGGHPANRVNRIMVEAERTGRSPFMMAAGQAAGEILEGLGSRGGGGGGGARSMTMRRPGGARAGRGARPSAPVVAPTAGASQVASQARGGTYVLRDPATGQVMRSGRTNDLARRRQEHSRDPALRDYDFEPVHRTDVYAEQRGLEQLLHETHNPPLNRIRGIDPRSSRMPAYREAAQRCLERLQGGTGP